MLTLVIMSLMGRSLFQSQCITWWCYNTLWPLQNLVLFLWVWFYYPSAPGRCCSALLPICHVGHSRYCTKKFKEILFPIDHYSTKDVCQTVNRTQRTANKVHNKSFYSDFLIHGGFIFVKLPISWEKKKKKKKRFKNLWQHHKWKVCGPRREVWLFALEKLCISFPRE